MNEPARRAVLSRALLAAFLITLPGREAWPQIVKQAGIAPTGGAAGSVKTSLGGLTAAPGVATAFLPLSLPLSAPAAGALAPLPAAAASALPVAIAVPIAAPISAPKAAAATAAVIPSAKGALTAAAAGIPALTAPALSAGAVKSAAAKSFDGSGDRESSGAAALAASVSKPSPLSPSTRLWAPRTVATPFAEDPMGVTIHRLSNGMTAYLSPNRAQPRVTGYVAVRAGSRQDPPDSTGMAHYLEHMLFKGTERLGTTDYEKERPHLERISALYETLFTERDPARRRELYGRIDAENQKAAAFAIPNEFDRLYAGLGFKDINAHTSVEETVYKVSFPSNRAEAWARTEAERFARPVFRLFQSELEAVYEENNMGQDDPSRSMWKVAQAAAFKGHPYARSTIGLSEHLKNPSLAKMYAFYDAWYRPDNMAVVLSGDFDRAEMLASLERNFGTLRARTPEAPVLPPAAFEPLKGTERSEISYPADEALRAMWRTPADGHPDVDALAVLERLLGDPQSGLLNLHLSQAQKVKSVSGGVWQLKETGAFVIYAEPKAGQTLEQAETLVMAELDRAKAGDFSEEDLRAAITNIEVEEKQGLESDDQRVKSMFRSYIAGEEWKRSVEGLERLRRVTKADVMRAASAYLGADRAIVYRRQGEAKNPPIEKPGFTPISIDPTRRSPLAAELAAMPAPDLKPRWLKEGDDYVVRSLEWGKLYWAKNPVSDLFSLKLEIPGGYRADSRMRVAAELLGASGAGDMSPAEFEQALARLGTRMHFGCGDDTCVVTLTGLEANLKESLRLMSLRFARPNIPRGTLQKLVKIELGARQNRRQDPEAIGEALLEYAKHGEDSDLRVDMSGKRLAALRTDELRRLLARTLGSGGNILYAGTTSPDEVARVSTLGRSRRRPAPTRAPRRIAVPAKPQVLFVHRKGMIQAHVGLFASDGPTEPDGAIARRFYNTVIGGMGGVVFQEVREARSLAYSAHGAYQGGARKGDDASQFGWVGSQADKAVEAAVLMHEILKRPTFGAERFDTAAREVLAFYRSNAVPFRSIPDTLLSWERQGFAAGDPRAALLEQARAFRLEDLDKLARRLQERTLTTYVIGDRDKLDMEGLKRLGEFREVSVDDIFQR